MVSVTFAIIYSKLFDTPRSHHSCHNLSNPIIFVVHQWGAINLVILISITFTSSVWTHFWIYRFWLWVHGETKIFAQHHFGHQWVLTDTNEFIVKDICGRITFALITGWIFKVKLISLVACSVCCSVCDIIFRKIYSFLHICFGNWIHVWRFSVGQNRLDKLTNGKQGARWYAMHTLRPLPTLSRFIFCIPEYF